MRAGARWAALRQGLQLRPLHFEEESVSWVPPIFTVRVRPQVPDGVLYEMPPCAADTLGALHAFRDDPEAVAAVWLGAWLIAAGARAGRLAEGYRGPVWHAFEEAGIVVRERLAPSYPWHHSCSRTLPPADWRVHWRNASSVSHGKTSPRILISPKKLGALVAEDVNAFLGAHRLVHLFDEKSR